MTQSQQIHTAFDNELARAAAVQTEARQAHETPSGGFLTVQDVLRKFNFTPDHDSNVYDGDRLYRATMVLESKTDKDAWVTVTARFDDDAIGFAVSGDLQNTPEQTWIEAAERNMAARRAQKNEAAQKASEK